MKVKFNGFGFSVSAACRNLLVILLLFLAFALQTATLLGDDTNQQNSIVRFEIIRGTNALGIVDVELFDQEKPETVRNFLLYVRSGAYTNTFLHRCVPGFIVQGGGFGVTNVTSTNRFSTYTEVTNYGRLTNEFLVGARMSNIFGTIAMAKLGNDPNSATSQWFFNLANNSTNLDNQNGGFTVFGRILETTNANEGAAVLEHFNRLSTNAGIVNLNSILGTNYAVFNSLPVSYTNTVTRAPAYRELYYTRISVLNDTLAPGVSAPTITVTSPPPYSRFTNQTVRIQGTATDDVEIARVSYRVGDRPWEIASGTTNWEATPIPVSGFNTVSVKSIDWQGNQSPEAQISFYFQKTVPLDLQITGKGTVAGITNGQELNAGATYTATGEPQKGNVFDGWSGSVTSSIATISFQAPTTATNFQLKASFIPDPLPTLTGTYHGLFQPLGNPTYEALGFMTLNLQSSGDFTGTILYHGKNYYFTGRFDSAGNAGLTGFLDGATFTFSLQLQRSIPGGAITGTLQGTGSTTFVQLERLAPNLSAATNAPPIGEYTFVIPNGSTNPPSPTVPAGNGFGTGTIDSSGVFTLSGTLADGTTFTASPKVSRLGRWPLYLTLANAKGALSGWISYSTNQAPKLQGTLQWLRLADGSAEFYPGGVTNLVSFAASYYTPPSAGTRVLNWVHGLARLSGTDLVPPITNQVKLTTNNSFEITPPNSSQLQLTLDLPSGRVNGSFVNPWFGTTNQIQSAVLVASNYIRGQYRSGNQIGSFDVDVTPYLATQSVASVTLPALTAAMAEGGWIRFEDDGVILLTNALKVQFNTLLDANGHSIIISGGGSTRLVEVPAELSFSAVGITFADGYHRGEDGASGPSPGSGTDGFGGGILSWGGGLGFTNCLFTNCVVYGGNAGLDSSTNNAPSSGGRALGATIHSRGPVTLNNCTITDGLAVSGGNRSVSTTNVISEGEAVAMGAAVYSTGGLCLLLDSTLKYNRAAGGQALPLKPGEYSRSGDAAGGAVALVGGTLRSINTKWLTNAAFNYQSPGPGQPGNVYAGALFVATNVLTSLDQAVFAGNSVTAGQFTNASPSSLAPKADGGAVYSLSSMNLSNCTFELNRALGGSSTAAGSARGGALFSTGGTIINGSTFNDNLAQGGEYFGVSPNAVAGGEAVGGAIFAANSLSITNSTFAYNQAMGGSGTAPSGQPLAARGDARGGAVSASSNSMVLAHVTMAYNEATVGLHGATNSGNAFGGGIANLNGSVSVRSSILATNTPSNFYGGVSDLGYNLSSDASFFFTATGSRTNTDPVLGPFGDNGGLTRTISLLPASPAVEAVRGTFPPIDQRGTSRPQVTYADIGAFEYIQVLPVFSAQPSGTNTVRYGTNAVFQAQAGGPGPIGYFWLKNDEPISGAVSNVLVLTNITGIDAGRYAAVATNSYGSSTSTVAILVVDMRPFIVTQPPDMVISPSTTTSVVVTATGPSLTYAWWRNQSRIAGATNSSYVISDAAPGAEGIYQVVITNTFGAVTSRIASVTWSSATLTILTQPQSQPVALGSPVTLTVLASGIAPIQYQWIKDNVPLAGATNNMLSFASAARTNGGVYTVLVSNPYMTLTSTNAVLTVLASPVLSIRSEDLVTAVITCFGDPGRVHRLYASSNLAPEAVWTQIGSQTMPGSGSVTWRVPFSTNSEPAYFRATTP